MKELSIQPRKVAYCEALRQMAAIEDPDKKLTPKDVTDIVQAIADKNGVSATALIGVWLRMGAVIGEHGHWDSVLETYAVARGTR